MIGFYSPRNRPYGAFSNFERAPFVYRGKRWPTSEHYYQARKFAHHPERYQAIQLASTPRLAADLGRDTSVPIRADWEQVKVLVMKRAVLEKFTQNPPLWLLLLSTGDEDLVEQSPYDSYWGCGRDGQGQNMLGVVLMQLRAYLRTLPAPHSQPPPVQLQIGH